MGEAMHQSNFFSPDTDTSAIASVLGIGVYLYMATSGLTF